MLGKSLSTVIGRYLTLFVVAGALALQALPLSAESPMPGSASPEMTHAQPSGGKAGNRLAWNDLGTQQQQALLPLASEWNKLSALRKKKWLAIADKYASMTEDEQLRLQERMQHWVSLSPQQRRAAREAYIRSNQIEREEKTARWEQYQQLPEEQKMELAKGARVRKNVTTLPVPGSLAITAPTLPLDNPGTP